MGNVNRGDRGGDDQRLQLMQTKMLPPLHGNRLICREHLLRKLDDALGHMLTVVVAPAGFGKTTLLADWYARLSASGKYVAWLSLDAEDDDLYQFGSYLLTALQKSCDGLGAQSIELIRNDPIVPPKTVLSVLVNEIAEAARDVVIILDDAHLLKSKEVNDTIHRLLTYGPPNLHLVLASRGEPYFALSRFRARSQLLRLGSDDLRFGTEEAELFFATTQGRRIPRDQIGPFVRATEGWVTGLQLASIAMSGESDGAESMRALSAASWEISAYLSENVMQSLPERVVSFLLAVSILDRLSPWLCVRVSGMKDSPEILEWLEERNLFLVSLSSEREWYRFHALFLDYLRHRASRENPETQIQRHREASHWLAENGLWQEAVKHALAAGDDTQAAAWVERCATKLIERSDLRTVLTWLERLPAHVIRKSIFLRLARAWCYSLGLRPAEAVATLDGIRRDIDSGTLSAPDLGSLKSEMLAVQALTAGLTDDSANSLLLANQVLSLNPPEGSWIERIAHAALLFGLVYKSDFPAIRTMYQSAPRLDRVPQSEPTYASAYRQCMFGLGFLLEGQLLDAERIFRDALVFSEARAGENSAAAVLPSGYLAEIYYEWDELDKAAGVIRDLLPLAIEAAPNGSASRFCVASARLLWLSGDHGRALAVLDEAIEMATRRDWLRMRAACMGELVRLHINLGELTKAGRIFQSMNAAMRAHAGQLGGSLIEGRFHHGLAMARLGIARGAAEPAIYALQMLCSELDAKGMRYLAARARIVLAGALHRFSDESAAERVFMQALSYGQENGLIRSFIDEEGIADGLLASPGRMRSLEAGRISWYLDDLGQAAGRRGSATDEAARAGIGKIDLASTLSARERQIVDCLARGLSNKEIARILAVSPETVKWHLKNIYARLDVTSRLQAVRWAQDRMRRAPEQ